MSIVWSHASEQYGALAEDAGAAVDDLVGETVLVDVVDDSLVVCAWLEPERGDAEGFGLFE